MLSGDFLGVPVDAESVLVDESEDFLFLYIAELLKIFFNKVKGGCQDGVVYVEKEGLPCIVFDSG